MKIIFDYNRTIFNPETDTLYQGVLELLMRLSVRNELFLVSRNEPGRANRLETLGISQYFKNVAFVEDKTPALFTDLVGDARDVVVVGDCLFDEIRIGNQLGYTTVWVQQGKFAQTKPVDLEEMPVYTVENITALTILLSMYA